MPTSLGSAVLELSADGSKLQSDVASEGKKAESTLSKIGGKMKSIGTTMSVAATLPILAIGGASLSLASDLEESQSKVRVVFGDSAVAIEEFASTASTNLGMSEQAALAAAGTYGNLFTAMGMGQEPAAQMSTDLVQLASDLASFNNIDPTEALEKLRAGLTGETEPLKSLGVNLSAAAIEAKAMEMGLVGVGEEMTAAAKAQASFALVMEQTKNAQGDFARTSDGLANSTRIAKAELADAGAQIGTLLLPIALQAVGAITSLVTWFNGLSPSVMTAIVVVAGLVAAIGPLLLIIGTLITSITAIIPVVTAAAAVITGPLLLAIGLAIAIIAVLAAAWTNNWGGIQQKTAAAVAFVKGIISAGLAAIQAWWNAHGAAIMAAASSAWSAIQSIIGVVISVIQSIVSAFQSAFEGDWYAFGENLRTAWDTLWAAITTALSGAVTTLITAVGNLITDIIAKFTDTDWGTLGRNIVEGIANGITNAIDWVIAAVKTMSSAIVDAVLGFLHMGSPSRVFADIGANMMAGLAIGIDENAMLPVAASVGAAGAAARAVTNNYYLSAQYPYQSETTLIDRVKMLTLMGSF